MLQNIFYKINNNSYNIEENIQNKNKSINIKEKNRIFAFTFAFTILIMLALTICSICSNQVLNNDSLGKKEKNIECFFIIAQNFVPSIITFVGAMIVSNIIESLNKKRITFGVNLLTLILLFPYVIFYMAYIEMISNILLIILVIIMTFLIVILSMFAYNEIEYSLVKNFKEKGSKK